MANVTVMVRTFDGRLGARPRATVNRVHLYLNSRYGPLPTRQLGSNRRHLVTCTRPTLNPCAVTTEAKRLGESAMENGLVFDWSGQFPSGRQFGSNGGAVLMPWAMQFGAQLVHKSLQMGSFSTKEHILSHSKQIKTCVYEQAGKISKTSAFCRSATSPHFEDFPTIFSWFAERPHPLPCVQYLECVGVRRCLH